MNMPKCVNEEDKLFAVLIDEDSPRLDGSTKPLNLTLWNGYEVLSYEEGMITVINDKGKRARYKVSRFSLVVSTKNR